MRRLRPLVTALALSSILAACGPAEPAREPELVADPPAGSDDAMRAAEAEASLDRATAFLEKQRFADARPHVTHALERDPKSAKAHFFLGVLEEHDKNVEAADKAYRAALERDPGLVEASLNLGALLLDKGDADGAIKALEGALAKGGDSVELRQSLGFAFGAKGDVTSASKHYDVALAKSQGPELVAGYAELLIKAGQLDKAKAVVDKGYAKAPEDVTVLATYGRLAGAAHAFDLCVKALDRAIKLEAKEPELYVRRGTCKHSLSDEKGAQDDFKAAIKVNEKFGTAHYYLGLSYLGEKKRAMALASLEKAAKLEPAEIARRAQAKLDELTKKK
jgi:Tfp pilus assembly protein PilF